ncbi:MAG: hypothetical protein ACI88G_001380 [Woeseiaceae bacterium]|jgi:hypothetical protein
MTTERYIKYIGDGWVIESAESCCLIHFNQQNRL